MAADTQKSQQTEAPPRNRFGIGDLFPEKPRVMWVRTYGCLLDEIVRAEIMAYEAQTNMVKRLAQVKNDNQME